MFKTKEEKDAIAEAERIEKEAQAKAAEETAKVKAAEAKAEAEKALAEAGTKEEANLLKEKAELLEEAKTLGIKLPRLSIGGLKTKDPKTVAKEELRQKKQFNHLLRHAIAKKKAEAKMKPIEKRRAVLIARLKVVKSRTRAHTYSDANIKAWIEELNLINGNPNSWNQITVKGTKPYTPGNKRKKTARDILDGMDLE